MVNQIINATYTETYDLNTAIGELSMLAVHTPQAPSLKRMFHGFFENYKKYRINGCHIRMVCASQQALTPDLVGLSEGQVDPRDILNPILFKACTGESINILLDQIYNAADPELVGTDKGSLAHHATTRSSAQTAYYQMLSDDTWRKEHPQRGLEVTGLRPMVHKVVTTQPFKWSGRAGAYSSGDGYLGELGLPKVRGSSDNEGTIGASNSVGFGSPSGSFVSDVTNPTVFVSNGLTDMPWLETAVVRNITVLDDEGGDPIDVKSKLMINDVPRVYMGCIILPPAILQRLFFRMQISWSVSFRDWRPAFEYGPLDSSNAEYDPVKPFPGMVDASNGNTDTYFNLYHSASARSNDGSFGKEYSSFTTTEETEVETVMEQGKHT